MHIIVTIIAIISIIYLFVTYDRKSFEDTSHGDINDIKELMKNVQTIFDEEGLQHWIICGTLLGAVRHNDVIPWDDDIDIAIHSKDENRLVQLKNKLKKNNYGLFPMYFGYKIYDLDGTPSNEANYNYPFIDIFIMRSNNKYCQYKYLRARLMWPGEWFTLDNLYPLRDYKLGDLIIKGPNKPYEYLNRSYGIDWPVIGYQQFDHKNYQKVKKEKFIISHKLGLMPYLFVYGNEENFNYSICEHCFDDFIIIHITDDNVGKFINKNSKNIKNDLLYKYGGLFINASDKLKKNLLPIFNSLKHKDKIYASDYHNHIYGITTVGLLGKNIN